MKLENRCTKKVRRSALIRRAPREHLKRQHIFDLEQQDRRGYEAQPQERAEVQVWENVAAWPEDRTEAMFIFANSPHRISNDRS
jgi:hypothetical protein